MFFQSGCTALTILIKFSTQGASVIASSCFFNVWKRSMYVLLRLGWWNKAVGCRAVVLNGLIVWTQTQRVHERSRVLVWKRLSLVVYWGEDLSLPLLLYLVEGRVALDFIIQILCFQTLTNGVSVFQIHYFHFWIFNSFDWIVLIKGFFIRSFSSIPFLSFISGSFNSCASITRPLSFLTAFSPNLLLRQVGLAEQSILSMLG